MSSQKKNPKTKNNPRKIDKKVDPRFLLGTLEFSPNPKTKPTNNTNDIAYKKGIGVMRTCLKRKHIVNMRREWHEKELLKEVTVTNLDLSKVIMFSLLIS